MKKIKHLLTITLTLLMFSTTFNSYAQKVKIKKGKVLIDKALWLTYDGCKMFSQNCSLYNSEGEEIIFMKWVSIPGVEPKTSANKDGSLGYMDVVFLGKNKKYEIQKSYKKVILDLYKAKVVSKDGSLNDKKIDRLVEKHVNSFSDRVKNIRNTIIIKEGTNKNEGSGINIKIGN